MKHRMSPEVFAKLNRTMGIEHEDCCVCEMPFFTTSGLVSFEKSEDGMYFIDTDSTAEQLVLLCNSCFSFNLASYEMKKI